MTDSVVPSASEHAAPASRGRRFTRRGPAESRARELRCLTSKLCLRFVKVKSPERTMHRFVDWTMNDPNPRFTREINSMGKQTCKAGTDQVLRRDIKQRRRNRSDLIPIPIKFYFQVSLKSGLTFTGRKKSQSMTAIEAATPLGFEIQVEKR
jgi:hypothetical protein